MLSAAETLSSSATVAPAREAVPASARTPCAARVQSRTSSPLASSSGSTTIRTGNSQTTGARRAASMAPASAPSSGVESGSFMQRLGASTPVEATIARISRRPAVDQIGLLLSATRSASSST